MLASTATVIGNQPGVIVSAIVTARRRGRWIFALLVASGIHPAVRQLLRGTREVETGHLDQSIDVSTQDDRRALAAFNRMVEQLRRKAHPRDVWPLHRSQGRGRPARPARVALTRDSGA